MFDYLKELQRHFLAKQLLKVLQLKYNHQKVQLLK